MPLKQNMSLTDIIIYLQTDLKASVKNDVYPVLQLDKKDGGYFAVPRLVLCYVDFLGALYCGFSGTNLRRIATSTKARRYLRNVMWMVDPGYRSEADALIEVYRHGTVHLYAPSPLKRTSDNRILEWLAYKGPRRQMLSAGTTSAKWIKHLECHQHDANTDVLPISINCMYEDLQQSIDEYCGLLQNEYQRGANTLLNNFVSAANQIAQPKPVTISW